MSRRPEPRRALDRGPTCHLRPARSAAVLAIGALLIITGCTAGPAPGPTSSPSGGGDPSASASATGSPTPTAPAEPTFVGDGTAEDNLPLFTAVTQAVWATPDNVSGRAYIDALVAAGFDKAAMQVTYDQSTVGNPAESIQFSVHWQQQCLIGQVGPATGAPVTVVVPELAGGACLVGATRPIDW